MQQRRQFHGRPVCLAWTLTVTLLSGGMGCAMTGGQTSSVPSVPIKTTGPWSAGTVIDVRTQQAVPFTSWLAGLGKADVIYIGEEHQNHHHIDAALTVLQALIDQGRRPVLGMEMFSWDGQAALDRQVSPASLPEAEFLEAAKWAQNWGGPYANYEPLVRFAQKHGLRARAVNAPRPLVRKVAKEGLAQGVEAPESAAWGLQREEMVDDPGYRETILGQLKACHGGAGEERHFQMMYEASLFRDEAMARTIAQELTAIGSEGNGVSGPMVSYTGGGHIQYRLPIPNRVMRRLGNSVKQVTIYLASVEQDRTEELQEWMDRQIADYIWLTPVGVYGAPARCR